MPRPSRTALLLAAALPLAGLLGGCDDKSSSAAAQIDAAATAAQDAFGSAPGAPAGSPDADKAADKAKKALAGVNPTVTADAPAPYQVQAAALLAAANDRVAANELARAGDLRLKAERLIGELHRRALDVRFAAAIADGFQQLDPKSSLAQIDQTLAGLQTGQTWTPDAANASANASAGGGQSPSFPTVQAVDEEIKKLQAQIDEAESKASDLDKRRTDLLNQSERAAQQAQNAKGQASVDAFTKSSNLRKQANDLAVDKSMVDGQLQPLRADLALAQARKGALASAVQTLRGQKTAVQDGWGKVQAQIQQLRSMDGAAMTGESGNDKMASIDSLASELKSTLADLGKSTKAADDLLAASAKGYGSASDTAKTAGLALRSEADAAGPRGAVYATLADALSPQFYQLREAAARSVAAELHTADFARLARQRAMLAAVGAAAKGAGGQVPAALAEGPVGGDLNAALCRRGGQGGQGLRGHRRGLRQRHLRHRPGALEGGGGHGADVRELRLVGPEPNAGRRRRGRRGRRQGRRTFARRPGRLQVGQEAGRRCQVAAALPAPGPDRRNFRPHHRPHHRADHRPGGRRVDQPTRRPRRQRPPLRRGGE